VIATGSRRHSIFASTERFRANPMPKRDWVSSLRAEGGMPLHSFRTLLKEQGSLTCYIAHTTPTSGQD
jgi:hypothetical protein